MAIRYVSADTSPLFANETGNEKRCELLWGDHVDVGSNGATRVQVKARGKSGWVEKSDIGDESLLEFYFIDVGQGDGVLIRTPDNRHILIDGGYKRGSQPTRKNAADFVDWKFAKDYGLGEIHLDAMIASHCDADHYGGLWDLLNVQQSSELDAKDVRVDAFYHAGVSWWVRPSGSGRWLGTATEDGEFMTQLLGSRQAVMSALKPDASPKLQGEWAQFLRAVTQTKRADGHATTIRRLSHTDEHLPEFDGTNGAVAIRVLAPVEITVGGKPALHKYDASPDINTNGNSILLRVDYGRARILLTGDLNMQSQRVLLDDYEGNRLEFQADVAKSCHHGSDKVSFEFLAAIRPAVTVISSGDSEGHDHPRPEIVAASGVTGYLEVNEDRIVTPLVYSTELARSVNLGKPERVTVKGAGSDSDVAFDNMKRITVKAKVTKAGDLNPSTVYRNLDETLIVAGVVYGLVNIRTDGKRILCATMNEKGASWHIKNVQSRF